MGISIERFKTDFKFKMSMITWKAAQWMQYRGYDYNKYSDTVTLLFRSSSYGISFKVEMKAFSNIYGEPSFPYEETYNYFKSVKYNECVKID